MGKRTIKRTTIKYKKEETYNKLIPTGCTLLDLAIGGGLPLGRVVNIVGDRSAGKTILTTEVVVSAKCSKDLDIHHVYDDAEHGYSIPTEKMYGMTIRKEDDYSSDTIQDLQFNLKKEQDELEEGKTLLYILDSVEGMDADEDIDYREKALKARAEGKEVKGSYGMGKARHMNELLRSKQAKNKDTLLVFVSQTRDKINATFGNTKTRHCEKALEFNCDIILYLRIAKAIEKTVDKKKYTIGSITEVMVKKNKVIGSKFKPLIIVRDGLGIDDVDTNLCFLYDLISLKEGIKEKVSIDFDGKQFKTRTSLINYIEDNNAEDKIKVLVKEKWEGIIDKLSVKNRRRRFKLEE